jgi:hypothetical protein
MILFEGVVLTVVEALKNAMISTVREASSV